MAREIVWSYEATDDVDAIVAYIARDSAFYAAAFLEEVLTASRSLDFFAESRRDLKTLWEREEREV